MLDLFAELIKLYNIYIYVYFTISNTHFIAPLISYSNTVFMAAKRYNLSLQIFETQTCFPPADILIIVHILFVQYA